MAIKQSFSVNQAPHWQKDKDTCALPATSNSSITTSIVPVALVSPISNRNAPQHQQIAATDDMQAIDSWLSRVYDSPQTYRSYKKEIIRLLLWAKSQGKTISELHVDDLILYKDFLRDPQPSNYWCGPRLPHNHPDWKPFEGPLTPASINQALVILGGAFSYWADAGYLRFNPMKLVSKKRLSQQVRGSKRIERYLEKELWDYLWAYIDQLPSKTQKECNCNERIRFVFSLLYLQSPRVSEVAGHRMGDFVQIRGKWWWYITGKGAKTEPIPVKDAMVSALERYRKHLGLPLLPDPDEQTPLVCSLTGKRPISADMVYRLVKETCNSAANELDPTSPSKAAWLRKASTHWMRHTSLTHQANSGVDLRYLQASARHASIETTQRYLHLEDDAWHQAMNNQKIPTTDE